MRIYQKYAYIFYDIDRDLYSDLTSIDLVIVDAPHHDVSREGAIFEVFDKVKLGGFLFLDDSKAEHMQKTLNRWKQIFPKSISIINLFEIGNGISLVRKMIETADEPVCIIYQLIISWIRALRNFHRIKRLGLND